MSLPADDPFSDDFAAGEERATTQQQTHAVGSMGIAAAPSHEAPPHSWHVPYICGPPLYIHYTLPAFMVLSALSGITHGFAGFLIALLVYGPGLFGTILVHEWGHCAANHLVGGRAEKILLWPMGGLAFIGHTAGHKADIKVAVAGPVTHIPQMVVWALLSAATMPESTTSASLMIQFYDPLDDSMWPFFGHNVCAEMLTINVVLFIFNLFVPAYPLDGGRVLANVLTLRGVPSDKAAKICCKITWVVSAILIIWGLIAWFANSGGGAPLFVLVPLWISYQAKTLWDLAQAGKAQEHPLFAPPPARATGAGAGRGGGGGAAGGKKTKNPMLA